MYVGRVHLVLPKSKVSSNMQVYALVVTMLLGTLRAAPQRPASCTSHILTFVSLHVIYRPHSQAGARAHPHTVCTYLHIAQNLHFAQNTCSPHAGASNDPSAHPHSSCLHDPLGRGAGPAGDIHGPPRPLSGPAATSAATPPPTFHCPRQGSS